jgi:Ca2+-binding RTX toxin-like protein
MALGVAVSLAGAGLWVTGVGPAGAARSGPAANAAPVAVPDSYTTREGQALTVEEPGVLANDTDADGDDLEAIFVGAPKAGSISLSTDGHFTYTPLPRFHGTDSFTYKADDGDAQSAPTTVTITVTPGPNSAPKAVADSYTVDQDGTLTKDKPGILANDTDADGDTLAATLTGGTSHGSIKLFSTGAFTYTPRPGYHGPDSFTYKVNDGEVDSAPATVSITVAPPVSGTGSETGSGTGTGTGSGSGTGTATDPLSYCRPGAKLPTGYKVIRGTSGKNTLKGTKGKDVILAGDGNDTVNGGGGNDIICGGAGDDVLHGGDGADRISGGAGNDTITGDAGNDALYGGAGTDKINGGAGTNIVKS